MQEGCFFSASCKGVKSRGGSWVSYALGAHGAGSNFPNLPPNLPPFPSQAGACLPQAVAPGPCEAVRRCATADQTQWAHLADVEDLPGAAQGCCRQLLGSAVAAASQIEAGQGEVRLAYLQCKPKGLGLGRRVNEPEWNSLQRARPRRERERYALPTCRQGKRRF